MLLFIVSERVNDLAVPFLGQRGNFVAVVDEDRTFRGLIDRAAVLELLTSFRAESAYPAEAR